MIKFRIPLVLLVLVTALLAWSNTQTVHAQEGQPVRPTEAYCLSCHGNPDIQPLTLPNGETVSTYVNPDVLAHSVHSPLGIECQACHTEITTYPHPAVSFNSARELSRSYYLACQKCHSSNYDKAQDSMHAQAAAQGNLNAAICTDCHGAHDVQPPDQPRAHISEICGQCHQDIYNQYKNSIHGSALIQQDNPDVPVCTDCHGVHDIHDPRTAQFRVSSPELCAGCHANKELMAKYGLNPDVYNLYELSWHGVDVSVYEARWPNMWHQSAVCTDCHGVHDILSTDNPNSSVSQANLLATCQKCHPTAGPNWIGAWVGHNKISLDRTPYLFYTQVFYQYFANAVLWLSAIYVLLQILRATVARVRRSIQ